jgi:chemotaxis protein methyltransferase CheR
MKPVSFASRPRMLAVSELQWMCHLVQARTGVVVEEDKVYLVEARLAALADREGFGSVRELLTGLRMEESDGMLHRAVTESLLVSETSFFRDLHPFESLRTTVLPALIERRAADRTLHLWCAACASGQEPYSLAILLREHFPRLADWNVRLIASDVSHGILRRAREGTYSALEVNRGLPASLLVRWFEKTGERWRVREDVRRMVEFRELNLAAPWPSLPPMDLILLRNALLYFDVPLRRAVLQRVGRTLASDGVLVLGAGESPQGLDDGFTAVAEERSVSFRKNGVRSTT